MSRSRSVGSHRILLAITVSLLLGLICGATSAGATIPVPGLTGFVSLKTSPTGMALRLSCSSAEGQACSGTIFITSDETLLGKKVIAVDTAHRTKAAVRLGQATFSLPAGSAATIKVKLNATGLTLLRRFHTISTFVLANEASPTSTPFIFLFHTVRFSAPRQKQRHGA
jgi:hypothetical protein